MNTAEKINKQLAALLKKADSAVDKIISTHERELLDNYKASLKKIKALIAEIYEKYGDGVQYSDLVQYNRLTNLENQIAKEIKSLTNQNIKTTSSSFVAIFEEQFYRVGFAFEQSLELRLGFGLLNPEVAKASILNPLDRIKWPDRMKDHAQQYTNQIKSELTQGLIQGEGYGKISKRITDKTGINAGKIIRIVRTEGHRVQSAARVLSIDKSFSAADRLGLKSSRYWIATIDNRTRDLHGKMDGQEADENGEYIFADGVRTKGPGLSGVAEHDINCRCTEGVKIGDFSPQFRRDNESKQIIAYAYYEEWRNKKGITL